MKKYWSDLAASLSPYVAGEQPAQKMIKLNTNENAYPPSPRVQLAVDGLCKELRLYPQPDSALLCAAIARFHGVKPSQVFCANGSDEALAMCFLAFFAGGKAEAAAEWFPAWHENFIVKTPDVTYSFYPVWAKLFGVPLKIVPLKDDYSVDVEKMCDGSGVILPNPNAPTAMALPLADIAKIAEKTEGVFVVDEAYAGFGAQSADALIDKYDNLAVVHTLSKSHSLAGLRVGYVLANENLIAALETVKDSFNSYPVDRLAQAGAIASLEDVEYFKDTSSRIVKTRENTVKRLNELGIMVLPSAANFIFARFENAGAVWNALREKNVLVRYFGNNPRTADFLRITIGTDAEMDGLMGALKEILEEK